MIIVRSLMAALLLPQPILSQVVIEDSLQGNNIVADDRIFDQDSNIEKNFTLDERPRKRSRNLNNYEGRRSLVVNPSDRQKLVWDQDDYFEDYKTYRSFGSTIDGRKTLSSAHYVVLPIYWKGKTWEHFDMEHIKTVMDKTVENYYMQSFGRFDLTYELMEQTEFTLSWSAYFQARNAAIDLIRQKKSYELSVDYDGIMMFFPPQGGSGTFCCIGGLGDVGGSFASAGYETNTNQLYRITRHEIGHNLGHLHHVHNDYKYRSTRPDPSNTKDGFDMMSGGNTYERSDFGVASKWFFNWVSDDKIVTMQPEGQTAECPTCLSTGTFKLKPFDDWWRPLQDGDILGIRIPIAYNFNVEWQTDLTYEYWLSYRTGVGGHLADGLSMHLVWFEFEDMYYELNPGCYFDSMNFDAFGSSDDKSDSVVTANSCYVITPPPYMIDVDFIAANAVRPIICVGSVDIGSEISVTVSFLDPENPPKPTSGVAEHTIECATSSTSESYVVDSREVNSFHAKGLGDGGYLTVSSVSSDQGWAWVYFFDGYPYSPIAYESRGDYGAITGFGSSKKYDCTSGSCGDASPSKTYTALFGEVFVVIPPMLWASEGSRTALTLSCKTYNCMRNEYMENGKCKRCPLDHLANVGAKSISQCWPCPTGSYLSHPNAPDCSLGSREVLPTPPPTIVAPAPTNDFQPSPVSVPAPDPSNCHEDPFGKFLMNVYDNRVIARTCTWLKKKVEKNSNNYKYCDMDEELEGIKSAKYVCFETCNSCQYAPDENPVAAPVTVPVAPPTSTPTPPPTASPTTTPVAAPVPAPVLTPVPAPVAAPIQAPVPAPVSAPVSAPVTAPVPAPFAAPIPAPVTAPVSPPTAAVPSAEDASVDDPRAKFLKNTKIKPNGKLKKIRRTCGWLARKQKNKAKKFCRREHGVDGVEPAKVVCPNTCAAANA